MAGRAGNQERARSVTSAIMMASHGRRGVQGLLIGNETQKVLTHSKISVLVYR
jgi:nucleotide-binding universal stress UspA family protein